MAIPKIINYKEGLTLVYKKTKVQKAVYFEFRFQCGLYNEPEDKLGISHFVEHSAVFSNSKYTKEEKSEYLKLMFYHNFATSKERVKFCGCVPDDLFEESFEHYCNYLTDININQEEFDNEKKVIIQEILRRKYDKDIELKYTFLENTYKLPYVRIRPAGIVETVTNLTKEDLENYFKENFTLKNCVITVVGAVSLSKVKKLIKKYFLEKFEIGEQKSYLKSDDFTLSLNKPTMKINQSPDGDKSVILIAHYFDLENIIDKSKGYMAYVFNEATTNAAKSYFRDKFGLTYHVSAKLHAYTNEYKKDFTRCYYDIELDCDKQNVAKILEVLPEFYSYLENYLLDKDKLDEIRLRNKREEKMKMPRSVFNLGDNIADIFYEDGYFKTKKENKKLKKINEKIKFEEINNFAKQVLVQKPYIYIVSNIEDKLPEYKNICKQIEKNLKWAKK